MASIEKFDLVSPLDYRYIPEEERKQIARYLSENARIGYQARVEAAIVNVLAEYKICSPEISKEAERAASLVKAEEVYEEEKRIKHDVRALVNVMRSKVSDKAKPFIHFSATSYDIVDTANSLRYKEACDALLIPALLELEKTLIDLSLKHKSQLQIGRTHGQHAEPITFGFALSSYVARLGDRIEFLKSVNSGMYGKFSGAVGAYNAQSLLLKEPLKFEEKLMDELKLKVAPSSTQIVMPEAYEDLQHALISTMTVLANLADDMRHLQRSEINEVAESFESRQVGSSTMPHKRNPINFENVKSMWKEFMPRMMTAYLDGISEHQRDLTNSASQRFTQEMLAALYLNTRKMSKIMGKVAVDSESMSRNFAKASNSIIAEPLYILLAKYGNADAHEKVRQLTLEADSKGRKLFDLAKEKKELQPFISKFTNQEKALLENPEKYTGLAAEKAEKVCREWKAKLGL